MILGNIFGSDGLIVVVIALVVIFGGSQLPKIARNVGSAGKEFRRAQAEAEEERTSEATPPVATAIPPVQATPPAPDPAAGGDNVTISKADLEALLDERLGKDKTTPS